MKIIIQRNIYNHFQFSLSNIILCWLNFIFIYRAVHRQSHHTYSKPYNLIQTKPRHKSCISNIKRQFYSYHLPNTPLARSVRRGGAYHTFAYWRHKVNICHYFQGFIYFIIFIYFLRICVDFCV